jgi:peptidoglycan/LPS O-acetylase OafA/YrhL
MYRRDVDFLRGLAILSVVFFHAGIPWARNGFIGVDVFFVISGYLITSITLRDIAKNEFKFLRFIERRARRILPGLLTTLALNVPLFLLLFSPKYIENIFKSYLSIMTFVPNFFFWRQSGYFDPKAELQLLLNTWSLGIEEQFYILFAIFAFFYVKKRVKIKTLLILSVLVFLISLISSITISQYKGGATFYLLPFRLWEFLAGSLIAILDNETRIKTISTKNQLILKCLGLVIHSSFLDKTHIGQIGIQLFQLLGQA